ncbi:MAG: hypothetical protein CNLJKLNK_01277 [Holosporales bacterium]
MLTRILLTLVIFSPLQANEGVLEGKKFSQLANKKGEDIKNENLSVLPRSNNPPQAGYNSHEELLRQQHAQKQTDETYRILADGYNNIGELKEVEFKNPCSTTGNPIKKTVTRTTEHECIESAQEQKMTFKRYLMMDLKLIPEVMIIEAYCSNHGWQRVDAPFIRDCFLNGHTKEQVINNPNIKRREKVLKPRSVLIQKERWISDEGIEELESLTYPNFEIEVDCIEGKPEKRNLEAISDPDEKGVIHKENEMVERPCWEKRYMYTIIPKPCYGCEAYKTKNCRQTNAECIESVRLKNGRVFCLKWKKTYACDEVFEMEEDLDFIKMNPIPQQASEANKNMYAALSKLEMLKHVEQNQDIEGKSVSVFKGTIKKCTKNFGGAFKDCCKRSGGWGTSLGLGSRCSAEEDVLKKMRNENRCVFLGKRVKKNFIGIVVATEEVHSCFPTALSKSIQEGARKQLGITFGTAEHPDCRGLTPQELERIDFSKIDMGEAFKSIHESTEKMAIRIQADLTQKQNLLRNPASIKIMERNNERFNVYESLSQVNDETKNRNDQIRSTVNARKEERKRTEGQ